MIIYFIKRALLIIPIILVVILIMFLLLYALPGTNTRQLSSYGGGDVLDSVFKFLNVGDNIATKYVRYCFNVFTKFEFGDSSAFDMPITRELGYRLKLTLLLAGLGLAATLLFGIPAGVFAAVHQGRWQDNAITFFTVLFSSIPSYALGLLLCLFFALKLGWLPPFGFTGPANLILPTITISAGGIASVARMTRSSMVTVLDQQYIMTLRSKGLRERIVVYGHALKNSLIPVVAVISGLVAQLLCGALIVEIFFSIPGLGSYLVNSISTRDSAQLLGCTVLIAFMLSVVSVLTDMLYAFVNPQFKVQFIKGARDKRITNEA